MDFPSVRIRCMFVPLIDSENDGFKTTNILARYKLPNYLIFLVY